MDLATLLTSATRAQASDIHLRVGRPPIFRVNGELRMLRAPAMTAESVNWTFNSMASAERRAQFEKDLELDFSYQDPALGRFRVNVLKERSGIAIVIRIIHGVIPGPEAIGLPAAAVELAQRSRGLLIVTGPAASGRSTTLASLLEVINNTEPVHILTIEDPIEFIFEPRKAVFTQREVGGSARSAATALSHAMHQDPDVIALGELRDLETISLALAAAEAGHLVLATMHTTDAPRTVDRLIDGFPAWQQQQIRTQLANTLQGIICQQLMPRADGRGRVAAREILLVNDAVRPLIREGKIHQLYQVLEQGARVGMMSMDRHLQLLINHGVITLEVAQGHATNPANLKPRGNAPAAGSAPPVSSPALSSPSVPTLSSVGQPGQTGSSSALSNPSLSSLSGQASPSSASQATQAGVSPVVSNPSISSLPSANQPAPAAVQAPGSRRIVVAPEVMASLQDSGSKRVGSEPPMRDAQAGLVAALAQADLGSAGSSEAAGRYSCEMSLEVPGPSGGQSWIPTARGAASASGSHPAATPVDPSASRYSNSSSGGWDNPPQVVEIPFFVATAAAPETPAAPAPRTTRAPRPIGLVDTRKLPILPDTGKTGPAAEPARPADSSVEVVDDEDEDEPSGATRRLSPGELESALSSLSKAVRGHGTVDAGKAVAEHEAVGAEKAVGDGEANEAHEVAAKAGSGQGIEATEPAEESAAEQSVARRLNAFLDDSQNAIPALEADDAALADAPEE